MTARLRPIGFPTPSEAWSGIVPRSTAYDAHDDDDDDEDEATGRLPPPPRLLVLEGIVSGEVLVLDGALTVVGRARDADLRLEDDGVSRHHCRLSRSGSSVLIEDLGSTNGTLVNGKPIARAKLLSPGDRIRVGSVVLQLAESSN